MDVVARAYDEVADLYASLFMRDLIDDTDARPWMGDFVERAAGLKGPVADLGCGPGHGVDFLSDAGLEAVGIDLSPRQLAQARAAFPHGDFRLGDLAALAFDDGTLGGILARYSIIHLEPARLDAVFGEWARVLAPGAPALLFFFASRRVADHGEPFDHRVATAYELFPETIAQGLERAGFTRCRVGSAPPPSGARPLDKGAVLVVRDGP